MWHKFGTRPQSMARATSLLREIAVLSKRRQDVKTSRRQDVRTSGPQDPRFRHYMTEAASLADVVNFVNMLLRSLIISSPAISQRFGLRSRWCFDCSFHYLPNSLLPPPWHPPYRRHLIKRKFSPSYRWGDNWDEDSDVTTWNHHLSFLFEFFLSLF